MIFALCKDASSDLPGSFTEGRLYAYDHELSRLCDDAGVDMSMDVEDERFVYLSTVCAVVLKPFKAQIVGQTVAVTAAEDDFLLIDGVGYQRASRFQLLDFTVLKPGMTIHDISRRCWARILRINERMQLLVEGCEAYKSCLQFSFAVRDGHVTDSPLVECINATGTCSVTQGKTYTPQRYDNDLLVVTDDAGDEAALDPERFRFV